MVCFHLMRFKGCSHEGFRNVGLRKSIPLVYVGNLLIFEFHTVDTAHEEVRR